jgi:hypothetical protein
LATTQDYVDRATFFQSTMAFSPLAPEALSHMTLLLRPSINMTSEAVKLYRVNMYLPGFTPSAERARDEIACKYYFGADGEGLVNDPTSYDLCTDDLNGLHRIMILSPDPHPAFERFVFFNTEPGEMFQTLTLFVKGSTVEGGMVMLSSQVQTELTLCCFLLPIESPANNRDLLIEVISTSPLQPIEIPKQPIKGSPEILRGNFWRHLQLKFNPPLSLSLAVVSVIVQSAQDIINQARIVVRVPGLTRRGGFEGDLGFNTAGNDWLLFRVLRPLERDVKRDDVPAARRRSASTGTEGPHPNRTWGVSTADRAEIQRPSFHGRVQK